jgi:hypothetical protein
MKNQITIEQGQELRKLGLWLVTNKNLDKVICVAHDYKTALKKSKNNKIWSPLTKI